MQYLEIGPTLFQHMPNIERLLIGGNQLTIDPTIQLCNALPWLKYLEMSDSHLVELARDIFQGCTHLENVDLSNNNLFHLPQTVMDAFDAICNANKITEVSKQKPLEVDLSGNTFSCHCHESAQSTVTWLHKTKVKLVGYSLYSCITDHGIGMIYDKTLCTVKDNTVDIVLTSISCCTAFFILINASFLFHKHKYRIRTKLYRLSLYVLRNIYALKGKNITTLPV